MTAALAFSAWLGLEALQGGPVMGGRVLDAQTGDPVAGAAGVVDGRTVGAAASEGVFPVAADSPRQAGEHVDRLRTDRLVHPVSSGQSSAQAPTIRVFGAYSLNADYAAVPFLVVFNQPVSPFLSTGGGAYGFEASIERRLRGHLGLKASVSRHSDPFRGDTAYCQPPFLCAVRVRYRDDVSAMYFTAGPVWTARENKRTSVFAHALVGAVRSRSTFSLSGDNVEYVSNPTSLPGWLVVFTGQPFGQPNSVSYGDHQSDVGLAAALGAGFDRKLAHRLQFRLSMDWDPTFLSRPEVSTNAAAVAVVPVERGMQNHIRLSLGVVWQLGR